MQSTYKYRFDHSTIYWTLIYIIVFVLLQKQLVKGIMLGGVKG